MSSRISGEQIREIRRERGQNQTEFGLELYETTPGTAQKLVSDLESENIRPGKACLRTLQRMRNDEI